MKNIFKYLVSVLAGAMTLAACQQEVAPLGTEISVDPATLSVEGQNAGNQTVTVDSDGDWVAVAPSWIKVSPAFGGAGKTTVTLSFADNLEEDKSLAAARKATVLFSVAEKSAELVVEQAGDPNKAPAEVKLVTCAEFKDAEDGAGPFKVIGTITNIESISPSTAYNNGNLTITDESGDLYLYRVGPGDGKKLEDLGLAVGDKITVEGKKGSYNNAPQMAQGGVILEIEKSLISVTNAAPKSALPYSGGEATVTLTCKADDFEVVIPEDASWLTVTSKLQNGELAVVELTAAANDAEKRKVEVEFVTEFNEKQYKATVTIEQQAKPVDQPDVTLSQIRESEPGDEVTAKGVVVAVHGQGAIIADKTAALYVYTKGAIEFAVGNNVELSGIFDNYYGTLQVKEVTLISNDNSTVAPEYPEATDYTSAPETLPQYSKDSPTDYPYVKVKGTLKKDDYSTYVQAGDAKVVLYKTENDWSEMQDKQVVVSGYMMGYNSKYSEYQMIEVVLESETSDSQSEE